MPINNLEKVDFSEQELIILYNYIPRLIEKTAILVNLSPNYYTNGTQETLLTEDNRGNYWIIATDNDIYWLFPITKLNGKINPRVNEAFNLLFQHHNYEDSDKREFILKKPAQVHPPRKAEGWILAEQGLIEFGNLPLLPIELSNGKVHNSPVAQEVIKKNVISSISRDEFTDYTNKTDVEINDLKLQIKKLIEEREKFKTEIQAIENKYSELENRIKSPVQEVTQSSHIVENNHQEITSNQQQAVNTANSLNLNPDELRIVETYNSNPVVISQQAKQVSETSSSIQNRSQGINEAVVLERQAQGLYWLFGRDTLYLMPKRGFGFSRSTIDTFRALFQIRGSKVTSKFKLLKPAKVVMIGSSQTWQLTEKGIIEFE
ncbi:hypothetical protein B6N60_03426 [Richelia sinica FACHB-800]|uniref:Uncharacterized protein n=1 Tax=Richelia sinica FACHB-800 TaxID=1357546 RepID=A0A975Y5Y8_9NOST|nr:hypothetical protein [Richelia sinica]MBD2663530.1 hypothetical protein [Richelia sinica FACHB-800]QXE24718.1 hypothetical protein B6N60_03426 [Richelia sinica FACHB-800]